MSWLLLLTWSCVGDSVGPGASPSEARSDGGPESSEGGNPLVELKLGELGDVVRGAGFEIDVALSWRGEQVPLKLQVVGLPPGFQGGAAIAVPVETYSAKIRISTDASVAYGPNSFQVEAISDDGRVRALIPGAVFIRGEAGSIDTSFGSEGRIEIPSEPARATKIIENSDGGFLIASYGLGSIGTSIVVSKYSTEGWLDSAFASAGTVRWEAPFNLGRGTIFDIEASEVGAVLTANYAGYWIRTEFARAGDITFAPSSKPAAAGGGFPFSALVEGDGVVNNGGPPDACRVVRNRADGEQDLAWGEANGQTSLAVVPSGMTCISSILAATSSLILGEARLESGRYLTLIQRSSGKLVVQEAIPETAIAAASSPDGGFYVATAGAARSFYYVSSTGSFTKYTIAVQLNSLDDVGVLVLGEGNPALVISDRNTRKASLLLLDTHGLARRPILELESLNIGGGADAGAAPLVREGSKAFEAPNGRVVVFHYRYPPDGDSVPASNPYWVVARYWL